ncbi:ATP-grasp fold amidoligase family protein [uncultured Roseibium sp.]|uniref:ATP-grasp fold amidoligase family protein n=1 Tax=uncultured Roseibium sp. TaxID=1936171 RepID=UPI0026295E1F|nr:ATP-grasp fold amidoligase family protein [uncultured Roseibium sp.]
MDSIAAGTEKHATIEHRVRRIFWRLISIFPDKIYLTLKYFSIFGRFPNWKTPTRFSEYQQIRKLQDQNPLYATVVDKAAAKDFIRERIGDDCLIPTYWVGTDLSEVDWHSIPLPAVVKPTHASGAGFFLWEKTDIDELMRQSPEAEWLASDHSRVNREWAYSNVPPRIIIEKLIGERDEILSDYRFYSFNGNLVHIEVRSPLEGVMHESVYSPDWELLPIHMDYYPLLEKQLPRPDGYDKMLEIARTLGPGLGFARIDLYNTSQGIFVGEITLYPSGGFETFVPDSYDFQLAKYWKEFVVQQ